MFQPRLPLFDPSTVRCFHAGTNLSLGTLYDVAPTTIAHPPMTTDSGDADAIRSLLDRMLDAWSRGDAAAYADCFSLDSDYLTYNGMHLRGRNENAELHEALFGGPLKGTRLSAAIESLVFLSLDVALVHTVGSGARRRASSRRNQSIQTLIVVKQDGQWRIRSFENTRIRPFSIWLTRQITG